MPEDDNTLLDEVENGEEQEFFMVDEVEEERACLTCSRLRVGNRVCGIYKPYNDFIVSKGKPSIETEFSCSEYRED